MSGGSAGPVAVALDLDGTLLDLPVDIEPARKAIAALIAPIPARPILAGIAAATARDPALGAAARAILDAAEVAAAAEATARPGAAALLAALAARGVAVGIVTDNGRACVGPALAAAGLPAPAVLVTRDELGAAKPAPDGVLRAAAALLPTGGTLWWAGDAARDVEAGRAARARLGAVTLTIVAVGVDHRGADRHVADLAALAALVG